MTVRVAFEMPDHRFTMEFIGEVFQNQLYREGLFNTFIIAFFLNHAGLPADRAAIGGAVRAQSEQMLIRY